MASLSSSELALALRAIAEAPGPTLSARSVGDSWSAPSPPGRQLFVEARDPESLDRGEPYETWVVELDARGHVVNVESFTSVTCRVGKKLAE